MPANPTSSVPIEWFCEVDSKQFGPLTETDLKSWIKQGRVSSTDLIWANHLDDWYEAGSFAEFSGLFPPPAAGEVENVAQPTQPRKNPYRAKRASSVAVGLGVAAIIMGTPAMMGSWIPIFGIFGLPLALIGGFIALVGLLSTLPYGGRGAGFAIAGLICCGTATVIILAVTGATVEQMEKDRAALEEMERQAALGDKGETDSIFDIDKQGQGELVLGTDALVRQGDYRRAIALFKQYVDKESDVEKRQAATKQITHLERRLATYEKQAKQKAAQLSKAIDDGNSQQAQVLLSEYSNLFSFSKDHDEVASAAKRFVDTYESGAAKLKAQATAAKAAGDNVAAIGHLSNYIKQFPHALDIDTIKTTYKELTNDPRCKQWLRNAKTYLDANKNDDARKYLIRVTEHCPDTEMSNQAQALLKKIGGVR